jgi:hypothetical protein
MFPVGHDKGSAGSSPRHSPVLLRRGDGGPPAFYRNTCGVLSWCAMHESPLEHLKALITQYTVLTTLPDMDRYRRITTPKEGRCIFRGCTEPIAWEDARGGNFLCEGHYEVMREWLTDARRGLLPGGQVSPVFSHDPEDP